MSEQDKEPTNDDQSKQLLYQEDNTPYTSVLKPIRVFEFITSMFLFFLAVYIIFIPGSPIPTIVCLLLIILNGIYAFVTSLEIIFQYGVKSLPLTPMFTFSMLGFLLFFIASLFLLFSPYTSDNFRYVKMTLIFFSFVLSLFFLMDILIVLAIWKNRCANYKKFYQQKELLFFPEPEDQTLPSTEIIKRDTTTSVSTIKVSPKNGETIQTTKPDHSLRKVSIARRREYVDVPTSVPSVAAVKVVEIQTEPKHVTVVESQTCKCELKEVLVQTMSKCEFCNQQLQTLGAPSTLTKKTSSQCVPCSTVIQLLRGGSIHCPCDPNCNCKNEGLQIEEQKSLEQHSHKINDRSHVQIPKIDHKEQQDTTNNQIQRERTKDEIQREQTKDEIQRERTKDEIQREQTKDEIQRERAKDDTSQALTGFTKMTVTVYCATPRTSMEVTTSTGSKEKIVTTHIPLQKGLPITEKSPRDDILIEQIEETEPKTLSITSESVELERNNIIMNEEAKVPVQIKDSKEITESIKSDVKELRSNQLPNKSRCDTKECDSMHKAGKRKENSNIVKNQKSTKKLKSKKNSKHKKEDINTYSRFLPLEDVKPRTQRSHVEQDYAMNIHEVITESPHGNRSKIISSVFQRNNKIEPCYYMEECDNYAVQTEDPCFQCVDIPAKMYTTLQDATTTVTDICTVCKKEKIPQTDIFQYSNIYKDNEGRICCDLCAPSHSNKIPIIINESKDILQKCSVCGNFPCIIDARSIGVVYKHDEKPSYCMKCGKLQS